jgi:hypothetical protein
VTFRGRRVNMRIHEFRFPRHEKRHPQPKSRRKKSR